MAGSPNDNTGVNGARARIGRQWQKIKHPDTQSRMKSTTESDTSRTPQRAGRQSLELRQPRSYADGLEEMPVTPDSVRHSASDRIDRLGARVEASLRQSFHELLPPRTFRDFCTKADCRDKPSTIQQTSQSEADTMSTAGQSRPNTYRGFQPITAPGPLLFIAFDKKEFRKNFSDEWYDKKWKQHTVRWNGKGRPWRYLGSENSLSQAAASDNTELDSDDEQSDLEEEEWQRMVGSRYLEGMRVGTVLRRPRYTTGGLGLMRMNLL